MSSVSSFPHNIHRGIKLFFLATIFSLVVGIIAVVVALREANNAFVSGIVSYRTLNQDGSHRLGVAGTSFALNRHTFAFVTHQKVQFHSSVFVVIVQLSSHLTQDVCHQTLINCSFIGT